MPQRSRYVLPLLALGVLLGAAPARAEIATPLDIAGRIQMVLGSFRELRAGLAERLAAVGDLPSTFATGVTELARNGGLLRGLLTFAAMLAVGLALERLVQRRLAPARAGDPAEAAADLPAQLGNLLAAFTRGLLRLAVFAAGATATLLLIGGGRVVEAVLLVYLGVVLGVRVTSLATSVVLAPDAAQRQPRLDDATARGLHRAAVLAVALGATGFLTCGLLAFLGAGESPVHDLMPMTSGAAACLILAGATLWARRGIAADLAAPWPTGGLAIGFGAQTLVRDIISGIFYLLDDAFRLGEYIEVGPVKGSVERISIRCFTLRHHRGALHTVPFGQIQELTNYSRDWAIMKLEFRVPFATDVELVRKLFKQIGHNLLERPEIGRDFIEPFKSHGVFGTDDDAFILRAKFMSKPGRQFTIRREIFTAVQRAFAENGIRLASRPVKVQIEDEADPTTARALAAGAAGAEVQRGKLASAGPMAAE